MTAYLVVNDENGKSTVMELRLGALRGFQESIITVDSLGALEWPPFGSNLSGRPHLELRGEIQSASPITW